MEDECKLENSLYRFVNGFESRILGGTYDGVVYLRGPDDRKVPLRVGLESKTNSIVYMGLGDESYLDDRIWREIHANVADDIKGKVTRISQFDTSLFGNSLEDHLLRIYSALTLFAMDYVDFKGKYVLDLGSGGGVLSLKAKKKGAKKVIAVDIKPEMGDKLMGHILVNCMNPDDFYFVNADICEEKWLNEVPTGKIDIVVANIGPHYGYADLAAIETLEYLTRVRTFIGGGYSRIGFLEEKTFEEFRSLHPRNIYPLLNEREFTEITEIMELERFSSGTEEERRVTFIAQKSL